MLCKLGISPAATALQVGSGDGSFLHDLACRFHQVTALDNSLAMLELASKLCNCESPDNVYLILADTLQDAQLQADCVVVNMVLHHFAAPAEALRQLAHFFAAWR